MSLFARPSEHGGLYVLLDVKRGDAGKAKLLVDLLALGFIKLVVKPIGGAGSGRTAYIDGQKLVFSQLPEGIAFAGVTAAIGDLAFVYPDAFQFSNPVLGQLFNGRRGLIQEMESLQAQGFYRGRLAISPRAPLVMPWHLAQDMLEEIVRSPNDIGTTVNGMGPIAACFFGRNSLRLGDLLLNSFGLLNRYKTVLPLASAMLSGLMQMAGSRFSALSTEQQKKLNDRFQTDLGSWLDNNTHEVCIEPILTYDWLRRIRNQLRPYICDVAELVAENRRRREDLAILATNGRKLHPVFGDYPMVTTSLISVPSVLELSGLPGSSVTRSGAHIMAAIKAYDTHVGEGHFPTELQDSTGDLLRQKGHEFGTVTGRPRRVGWLDLVSARTGMHNQDCNELAVTRLDILSGLPSLKICPAYDYQGRKLTTLPAGVPIEQCQPDYVELPGWSQDISGVTNLTDLPSEAITYLTLIADELGYPVTHVGTGPAQNECIRCNLM
ncbi:adenylosuccinate synthetase [Patescibacteria group bacterium]|nr:adenylosuccinate synthetase [Patescibacteria group bacterium]MBU1029434.1 adenylosuccinate synthetase [Patescibacteria group bacterium]